MKKDGKCSFEPIHVTLRLNYFRDFRLDLLISIFRSTVSEIRIRNTLNFM